MSLDNIKGITVTARDNLVNAIRSMGVPIAEDSTINQCANAILQIKNATGGMSAGYVVVEDNGVLKAQKLSFDGTTPQFDGVAEEITDVGIFETGMEEPAYNGSGTGEAAKYYKCASVNTSEKTWSGYELILQDGVYVVSDTITEGLTYTGFTPIVGTIYNEDTTLTIGTLFSKAETLEGCVFAANMQTASATYNGETVNLEGITLADAPGYTDGTKALAGGENLNYPVDGANNFADGTISIALSVYWNIGATSGSSPYYFRFPCSNACNFNQDVSGADGYETGVVAFIGSEFRRTNIETSGWHHFVFTYSKGTVNWYMNGILFQSWASNFAPSSITAIANTFKSVINVYMKDLQIYNRVLSEEEIITLYEKAKLPTA